MLAFLPSHQIEQYFSHIELRRFTPNTIDNVQGIRDQLEHIRRCGYAVNLAEYEITTMAIAAPVFENGQVIGALLVQFPTFRYRAEEIKKKAPEIVKAAQEITAKMSTKAEE